MPSKRFVGRGCQTRPALACHKYAGSLRINTTIFRSRAASPLAALLPHYNQAPSYGRGLVDKFILKTGSSLFPKICRSYFLFTPHGLGDFLDQFELVPLFQLGQLVADLTGGKAALRTQAKTVERDILFCLMDAGDYKVFPYPDGAVVIDNPPFSILASICTFYLEHGIPFFLFAPSLTCFSGRKVFKQMNHIIADCQITYENGARVKHHL